jgi:hypothetical protein
MKSKRQNRRCATGVLQILLCLGCGGGFAFANADEPISLEQAEARGIWTPAKIKMPLRYDNPLTPQIECLSVYQTPAYKLIVDGQAEWFRDHYIVAEYESQPQQLSEDMMYWRGNAKFRPRGTPLEAVQYIAGAYGIKPEAAEKYAYASSNGVFGMNVTMCKQYGGKTHPVIVDRYRFVEPTRVPAKPPRPWEGPPEFAKHPELELLRGTDVGEFSRFDPQPEMEHEVLTDVVEIVDAGPKWDNPETPGVERYRIWRGGSHFVQQKDREWYEMRDWFLVSEEDLTIWAEEGPDDPFESEEEKQRRKPKPNSSFGMEPWDLPLLKAVEMATHDVKLAKFEEENPRREEDPFGSEPDLRDYDDYGPAGAQLVHRTFKGKPITLWCVLVADGRVSSGLEVFDDCEARLILMNGKIIRPVKMNVLQLLRERRNQDIPKFEGESDRLLKVVQARKEEIKRLDELGKTQK